MTQMEANSRVDAFLQLFPGPIALQGQKPNDVRVFLSCLFFLVLGAAGGTNLAKGDHIISGWFLVTISGILILLALASVIWPPGALTLGSYGFQQRIFFFWFRFSWQDVGSDFVVQPVISPYGRLAFSIVYLADLSIEELADFFRRWRDKALSDAAIHSVPMDASPVLK